MKKRRKNKKTYGVRRCKSVGGVTDRLSTESQLNVGMPWHSQISAAEILE